MAVRHSVMAGLEEYGDDFALVPVEYDHSGDDLAWIDEADVDDSLAEVYATATEAIDIIPADAASSTDAGAGAGAAADAAADAGSDAGSDPSGLAERPS
jgi:hypothetical protein